MAHLNAILFQQALAQCVTWGSVTLRPSGSELQLACRWCNGTLPRNKQKPPKQAAKLDFITLQRGGLLVWPNTWITTDNKTVTISEGQSLYVGPVKVFRISPNQSVLAIRFRVEERQYPHWIGAHLNCSESGSQCPLKHSKWPLTQTEVMYSPA